jgi:pimeloyl-ACP methyl ester carboxylesterase
LTAAAHCGDAACPLPATQRREGVGLPPAVSGERLELDTACGRISYYRAGPDRATGAPPLVLVHSINAAAAAHEIRPPYEHYRGDRAVYAIDMPGYGFSERAERLYTPRLMTDALHAVIEVARADQGGSAVDLLALSLSSEYAARAATERPAAVRSLALIAPTGFNREEAFDGEAGSTRGIPWLYRALRFPLWSRALFNTLTSRPSVRLFLRKTGGRREIDQGLLDYSWRTARQPGAHYAPYSFLSAYLFSADISRIYEGLALPIWMVHGVRGDFTDYRRKRVHEGQANWRIQVFDTGALPHFEQPDRFTQHYDAFLAAVAQGRAVGGGPA